MKNNPIIALKNLLLREQEPEKKDVISNLRNDFSVVVVSFDEDDFIPQYVCLALKSTNHTFYSCKKDAKSYDSSSIGFKSVKLFFLIIPCQYENLFDEINREFENEVKWTIKTFPKSHIVFVCPLTGLSVRRIQELVDSTKRLHDGRVSLINPSITQSFSSFTQQVAGFIMPDTPEYVRDIYTPFEGLVTVKKTSPFSELHYKMSTLGVRHCPVVDPKTRECYRVISRRDLVKLIPPGNTLITAEVQDKTGITISPSILIDLIDELGDQKIDQLFPDQDLISVEPDDPISKAIELLSIRHTLGHKNIYISGLPVISNKKLLGFLSYTDVFKHFIRGQETFLQTTVEDIATIDSPEKPVYRLHESQCLRDALMRMESLGVRSLPVVDKPKSDKLIGFVEDVQVMAYNHPAFAEELGTLSVNYFMTSLDRLYTPMPGELLGDCLHKFWDAPKGMYPPSTLVICNTKDGDDKRLRGVISCVDILRKWRETQAQEIET